MSGVKSAKSLAGLRSAVASGKEAPLPVPGDQVPEVVRPMRTSINFDKGLHHRLKQRALDHDTDVSTVLRVLASEMLDDEALADRVRARLAG